MTMLSTPTLVNQLTAGGQWVHGDCGEADVRSVLVDAGHNDAVALIERTIGGDLRGGTNTVQLAAALSKLGVPASPVATVGDVDAALGRRHRSIVEIPSDIYGNPDVHSVLGHFVLVYGFDGANYHAMNPLGGRLVSIPSATLFACERLRGFRAVEVEVILPADQAAHPVVPQHPVPAPPQGMIQEVFAGTVQVATANVRGGPSTGYPVLRQVHNHQALGFDGFTYGMAVWDPVARQMDRRWFHVDRAHGLGWIAGALVNGNPANSHP